MNKEKKKPHRQAHTADTKYGSGDYYGTGVKNPVGRVRESYMDVPSVSNKAMGRPPKSLA